MSGGLVCMVYYFVKTYAAMVDYAQGHLIMIYGIYRQRTKFIQWCKFLVRVQSNPSIIPEHHPFVTPEHIMYRASIAGVADLGVAPGGNIQDHKPRHVNVNTFGIFQLLQHDKEEAQSRHSRRSVFRARCEPRG